MAKDLLLYVLPGCPYCAKVLNYMDVKGINIPVKSTSEPGAREELERVKQAGRKVPVDQTDLVYWKDALAKAGLTTLGDLADEGDLALIDAGIPQGELHLVDMTLNKYGLPDRSDQLLQRQRDYVRTIGGWDALDPLFNQAAAVVYLQQDTAPEALAATLQLDNPRAKRLIEQLEGMGVAKNGKVAVSHSELLLSLADDDVMDLLREW